MSSSNGPSSPEDFATISELFETLDRDPMNLEIRRVLAEVYESFGWIDEAAENIRAILSVSPGDAEAKSWLVTYLQNQDTDGSQSRGATSESTDTRGPVASKTLDSTPKTGGLEELEVGYRELMMDAKGLLEELQVFQVMCPELKLAGDIADLKAMSGGKFRSVIKATPPPVAHGVARRMIATTSNAENIAFEDLEANTRWIRSQHLRDADEVRDSVRKRAEAIKSTLSKELGYAVDSAFIHIEHEVLGKTYQNEGSHTMLGELIAAIPRVDFWVSEDGFAWDMTELAAAIKANKGVMRNPLSQQMFTTDDVRAIIRHPSGKGLAALQVKQKELTKGIRQNTVEKLDALADILLADQSADSSPSRDAVDDFLAYMVTLPETEQDAMQDLRVPARDSHTGQLFDMTIGQSVADAKANRQCFHKTGDLLKQAAKYLRASSPGAWRMAGGWYKQ